METNRFVQLRKIFDEAIALPAPEWPAFVGYVCGEDQELYADAMELLVAHQNAGTAVTAGGAHPSGGAEMVGPYRIVRELGSGGMGVVYLAVRDDGTFRKNVAIKLLKRNHAIQDFVQRFHQERQVLANLDHPNIARILDGGQTPEGLPYHVMEYVEGLTLDRFCDTQKLDLADRIRLFQQVVSAVGYLHENLVLHRDLKPSNILVTGEGQVKLLDFGIAKIQTPVFHAPDLTRPVERLLTPSYASPEQISGAPVAKTSDIYSLGVVLYELLTGRLPYEDSVLKLTEEPQPPSANIREDLKRMPETTAQLRRRIVGDLDQIVLLCLRRDPRRRYISAGALAEDLRRFLEGRSVLARREPAVERAVRFLKRNRVRVAICATVLAALGIGTWQMVSAQIHGRLADAREAVVRSVLEALERKAPKPQPGTPRSRANRCPPSSLRAEDVRKLRNALKQDFGSALLLHPGLTPERKALLQRATLYLDGVRPCVAQDAALATEVAGAYQELGVLYEASAPQLALVAYGNTARMLEEISGGDPSRGSNRRQWELVVTRITGLGGMVPVLAPTVTQDSSSDLTPEPTPESRSKPTLKAVNETESPSPHLPVQPPVDPAELESVSRSLEATANKSKLADETFAGLKADLEKRGETLHSDIVANHLRMQTALESARRELEKGDLAASRMDIDIANEYARRLMKVVGR
jgi:eukaryotic-like serine/threonine-protein kinase